MTSSQESSKNCTVAIVGGGIGGLALATGLLRRNVSVQIYEAASSFEEVGLGLSIGPAAHRAMPLIDPQIREIYDRLITTHADSPGYEHLRQTWFEIVWASGNHSGETLMDLKAPPSGQTTVRRADFLDAWVKIIPKSIAHFGKRLENLVENDTGVILNFKDGTSAIADIVIGCDGIKSKVKESILPMSVLRTSLPRYSGMYGYRTVLDMPTMISAVGDRRARVSTMYIGKNAYAISYPIKRAQEVNVGLYILSENWDGGDAWTRPANKSDMQRDFVHMGPHIQSLMNHFPAENLSQWAIFEHPSIPTFTSSRIAILGDAAHASTPHQGAGAGQAIEDAHVLSELLGDPHVRGPEDFVAALKAYDNVRRPRSQEVVTSSKENAYVLCLCKEGIMDDEERLKETFERRFQWLWDVDVEAEVERARGVMLGEIRRQKQR